MTHGRYGYVDPTGEEREYSYTSGIRCDPLTREVRPEQCEPPAPTSVSITYLGLLLGFILWLQCLARRPVKGQTAKYAMKLSWEYKRGCW